MNIRGMAATLAAMAAGLGLLGGVAARAEDSEAEAKPVDYAAMSDEELLAQVTGEGKSLTHEPCKVGQPVGEEMVRRNPENAQGQRIALTGRMFCNAQKGEYKAASDDLAALEKKLGGKRFDTYGLYLALRLDDADGVIARLQGMVLPGYSGQLHTLEPDLYWWAVRTIRHAGKEAQLDQFALDAFQRSEFSKVDPEIQSSIAYRAIKPAIAAGKTDLVPDMLRYVRSPSSFIGLLASRDYEAIWPQVERHAGRNLGNVSTAYRVWALARLGTDPKDRDKFADAVRALHYDGKFAEAVALVDRWRSQPEAFKNLKEGDAWAMNLEAYSLDSLGREKEADAIFDQLATLDPEKHNWVVNFVINRASRLINHGRWEDGLEASALARKVADKQGSTFARMIVANNRTCVLYKLGRGDEAKDDIAYLLENKDDGVTLATQALQCAGRDDEAAAILTTALGDEATRDMALSGLKRASFGLFYAGSVLPDPRDLMATHPDLQAAFERYARTIPDKFIPRASLRRAEIAAGK